MRRPRMPYFSFASTTIERPSCVSSEREASCAASASSFPLTPGSGMNSAAGRLPSVIVPVLGPWHNAARRYHRQRGHIDRYDSIRSRCCGAHFRPDSVEWNRAKAGFANNDQAVHAALEKAGVVFIVESGDGARVRLRSYEGERRPDGAFYRANIQRAEPHMVNDPKSFLIAYLSTHPHFQTDIARLPPPHLCPITADRQRRIPCVHS
jgi:hypothetical protein